MKCTLLSSLGASMALSFQTDCLSSGQRVGQDGLRSKRLQPPKKPHRSQRSIGPVSEKAREKMATDILSSTVTIPSASGGIACG